MGLRKAIASGAKAAMKAAGDIPVAAVFTNVTGTDYNPSTGVNSETKDDYPVSGLLYDYTAKEIADSGGRIKSTDQKFMLLQEDLPIAPSLISYATISAKKWNIEDYGQDPAGATWIFQLRKP